MSKSIILKYCHAFFDKDGNIWLYDTEQEKERSNEDNVCLCIDDIPKLRQLFNSKRERVEGERCLNCGNIDPDDGPICSQVYGENFDKDCEITEDYWCKNYIRFIRRNRGDNE